MKKSILLLIILTAIFLVTCQKFETGVDDNTNPIVDNSTTGGQITNMSDLVISDNFDWRMIKTLNVQVTLPEDDKGRLLYIYSENGNRLYYKGHPEDDSNILRTKVTVPTYESVLFLKYGKGESYPEVSVYFTGTNLNFDIGSSFKSNLKDGGATPEFECETLWSVDDQPGELHYSVLSESPVTLELEGDIDGVEGTVDIESLAIDGNGDMYFINVSGESRLYKIPFSEVDKNSSTDVQATLLGGTGLSGSTNKITNLTFIGDDLYGIGARSEKVYQINKTNGSITQIGTLGYSGTFKTCGLSEGEDGTIYLLFTKEILSELWKFNSFPNGGITKVMDIIGSKKVESLAAHPNGFLYAADDYKFFKLDPINHTVEVIVTFDFKTDIEGVDFYWEEELDCVEDPDPEIFGTIAFEDLWPGKGDYDINDLVIEYDFIVTKDDNEFVESIEATFEIRAFGAGLENAFGFTFPNVDPFDIVSATGYNIVNTAAFNIAGNGTELGQSKATFILYDNTFRLMQHPGSGIGVNTDHPAPYVTPAVLTMNIVFAEDAVTYSQLDIGNFNPFIVKNQNRDIEIHLPDYPPTDLANHSYFGTLDDDTNPPSKYYLTENNLPWAILIPERFDYPVEKQIILGAYYHFADWAQGDGIVNADWYKDLPGYRNASVIY